MLNKLKNIINETSTLITQLMKTKIDVESKSCETDLVTNVDKQVEKYLKQKLHELTPNAILIGEESIPIEYNPTDELWFIDPIDGTNNFVKTSYNFGFLLAYYKDGDGLIGVIVDYSQQDVYIAIKDQGVYRNDIRLKVPQKLCLKDSLISISHSYLIYYPQLISSCFGLRYYGSSVVDGLAVINGRIGAYCASKAEAWDMAAHYIFAKELDLALVNSDGTARHFYQKGSCIFANKGCVQELINLYCAKPI